MLALTIILVIILFMSLVLLHEWGHFMAAKRGGVEVEEFGFGFPPRLFGRRWRGTLYSINLLPLGGFVKLKGEDEADNGPGTFTGASFSAKAKILLAGVGMNLVVALVLFYALCVTGLPGLGSLEPKFLKPSYAQPKQLIVTEVVAGSPAAAAGLKRGDYLISANGQRLEAEPTLRDFTKVHAGETVTLHVRQGANERDVTAKLRGSNEGGHLGVGSQQIYKLRYDPLSAIVAAVYVTGAIFVATLVGVFQLLLHIPSLIGGLFTSGVPKAAQGASGPIGIVFIMQSLASLGIAYVVLFTANISVALAAFNVLPLPALDGGRLAVLAVTRLTKRRINPEVEARYHTIGFMMLLALMLLISFYDLRKFF